MKIKLVLTLLVTVISLFLMVGCSNDSLVGGTWVSTEPFLQDIGYGYHPYYYHYQFFDNGTGVVTLVWATDQSWRLPLEFRWSSSGGNLTIDITADGVATQRTVSSYSISRNSLTTNTYGIEMNFRRR